MFTGTHSRVPLTNIRLLAGKLFSNKQSIIWNHINVGLNGLQRKMENFSGAMKEQMDIASHDGMTMDQWDDRTDI